MSSPNNLPQQLTSFTGRQHEIAEVKRLLATTRLLTLTGMGGTGKTRLALQVAECLLDADEYPGGVWFVDLSKLVDPALVSHEVASALGLREEPGCPLIDTISSYLRPLHVVLVLDNCEHLITACALLVDTLLRACSDLRILATSRQTLNSSAEVNWPVPPLSLPISGIQQETPNEQLQPQSLVQSEAMQLFIERATLKRSNFAITPQNAPSIAKICLHLDGIPLAIELAAARVNVLTVEEIVGKLEERFRLLVSHNSVLPSRQQTLKSLLDWSYDLLLEAEQAMLRTMSVFVGSFSRESVGAIWGGEIDEYETIELLSELVDKSLVIMVEHDGKARYQMLETVREYAWEKLRATGEMPRLRRRHRDWYLNLAEEAESAVQGPEQVMWLDLLDVEHDNIRAAFHWILEETRTDDDGVEINAGLRLCNALYYFWHRRGYISEGREWLAAILDASAESSVSHAEPESRAIASLKAAALFRMGGLVSWQGDYDRARSYCEQSLELYRKLGEESKRAQPLLGLGDVSLLEGNFTQAGEFYEESMALSRDAGTKWDMATALTSMGYLAYRRGDHTKAKALWEEALDIFRELEDEASVANVLRHLASLAFEGGAYSTAQPLLERSLAIMRKLKDKSGISRTLNNLGEMVRLQGNYAAARTLYEESYVLEREVGNRSGLAVSTLNLGLVAHHEGNFANALAYFQESLRLSAGLGDKWLVALCLAGLGGVFGTQRHPEKAAQLLAASDALREALGAALEAADRIEYERNMDVVRAQLNEAKFSSAWEEGRAMSMEQAVEYSLQPSPSLVEPISPSQPASKAMSSYSLTPFASTTIDSRVDFNLTKREIEVLRQVAVGLTNPEIAQQLSLSINTVESHLRSIYSKLGVTTRTAATRLAFEHRIYEQ